MIRILSRLLNWLSQRLFNRSPEQVKLVINENWTHTQNVWEAIKMELAIEFGIKGNIEKAAKRFLTEEGYKLYRPNREHLLPFIQMPEVDDMVAVAVAIPVVPVRSSFDLSESLSNTETSDSDGSDVELV